jgi:hypothetical protein
MEKWINKHKVMGKQEGIGKRILPNGHILLDIIVHIERQV